jgi:hypothetical protein
MDIGQTTLGALALEYRRTCTYSCTSPLQAARTNVPTWGIRQNLFEIYYFEKLHAPRARGARARAKVGGMSQL